jgi:hypothetical protein
LAVKNKKIASASQGMGKKTSGINKKEKKDLLDKLNKLDIKVEITLLTPTRSGFKAVLKYSLKSAIEGGEN